MENEIESTRGGYEPTFSAIWVALVGIIIAYLISSIFYLVWIAISHEHLVTGVLTSGDLVSASLGTWCGFLGTAILVSKRRGTGSLFRDYNVSMRPLLDIPVGVAAGLVLQFVILPLVYLPLEKVIPNLQNKLSAPAQLITSAGHGFGVVLVGVVLVIGAPFVEEIFFRGLLLQSISFRLRRLPRPIAQILAVLLSAIGFGIAHGEALQLLGLVAVGIVLAILRIRFNRLGPGMATHATFNLITFLALVRH